MIVFILVIESPEGIIEECKVMQEREIATENIIAWAEDNNIVLDTETTESELYFDEDDEGEYIYRIIDESAGQIRTFSRELESY